MRLDDAQRRAVFSHPAGWIASGLGSGLSPFASGTVGSAVALVPWFALRELSLPLYFIVIAIAFAIGVWASNIVVRKLSIEDPGVIVWDEFVGQWIALAPLLAMPGRWWSIPVAFLLFRIFDVWKPWPVRWADRSIKGGLGVMADDVLAGIYAAAVLAMMMRIAA